MKNNTLKDIYPEIAKEWHPTKNSDLTPERVTSKSNKKVWWKCKNGHEWEALIAHRSSGSGCPYCSNKKVQIGYNDLATTDPELAAEWHPSKNGSLFPTDLTRGSGIMVWWICKKGHEWCTSPNKRTSEKPVVHIVQIKRYYMDTMISLPQIQNLPLSGIQREMVVYLQTMLQKALGKKYGGNAPEGTHGNHQSVIDKKEIVLSVKGNQKHHFLSRLCFITLRTAFLILKTEIRMQFTWN